MHSVRFRSRRIKRSNPWALKAPSIPASEPRFFNREAVSDVVSICPLRNTKDHQVAQRICQRPRRARDRLMHEIRCLIAVSGPRWRGHGTAISVPSIRCLGIAALIVTMFI